MEAVGRGSEAGMDAAILLRHTDFLLGHTAGNSFAWKQSIAGPKQEYSGGHAVFAQIPVDVLEATCTD